MDLRPYSGALLGVSVMDNVCFDVFLRDFDVFREYIRLELLEIVEIRSMLFHLPIGNHTSDRVFTNALFVPPIIGGASESVETFIIINSDKFVWEFFSKLRAESYFSHLSSAVVCYMGLIRPCSVVVAIWIDSLGS